MVILDESITGDILGSVEVITALVLNDFVVPVNKYCSLEYDLTDITSETFFLAFCGIASYVVPPEETPDDLVGANEYAIVVSGS